LAGIKIGDGATADADGSIGSIYEQTQWVNSYF
jgi:hypothetical protein